MSTYVVPVGRHRASGVLLVIAVVVAVTIAVLGVLDASRAGSSEGREAPAVMPTPDWLQRYLDVEAPTGSDVPAPAAGTTGERPVNAGLR